MTARTFKRPLLAVLIVSAAYLMLLSYPQPLFAYELRHAGITLHATEPIPEAMKVTLERARARLDLSPLAAATRDAHVFICDDRRLFALFARQNYNVGGISDWLVGQHVFLRESDMQNDRLISPSGRPVAADRPLSYFIAHELMHIAQVRHVGRARYSRLPQWVDDGYADYVARDIDLSDALQKFKANARELDPRQSGLYVRYQLLMAYLFDKKHVGLEEVLAQPPDRQALETELRLLGSW